LENIGKINRHGSEESKGCGEAGKDVRNKEERCRNVGSKVTDKHKVKDDKE
jgi:hypothetical protein